MESVVFNLLLLANEGKWLRFYEMALTYMEMHPIAMGEQFPDWADRFATITKGGGVIYTHHQEQFAADLEKAAKELEEQYK